jgi:hypothetical protein
MIRFFLRRRASESHLSEDTLTRLVCRELSPAERLLAGVHLNRCGQCRTRRELRERAARIIAEHHQYAATRLGPLCSGRRDRFLRELDLKLECVYAKPRWQQLLIESGIHPFGSALTPLMSTLILICCGFILFSLWRWQLPVVSAAEFLDRAITSDKSPRKIAGSGVICRRFRIKTTKTMIEHAVYRDTSDRRQPEYVKLGAQEADLAARLALAGVDWDDPLSAISFKIWHDRQQNPKDEIHSSGNGLLTISTRVPSASIQQETLTVREDGFHPVERTVEYRKFGTVDISEVSLDVLSGDAPDKLFPEIQPGSNSPVGRAHPPDLLPSTAEKNETELKTRLMLSQVSADTGEQIEITRDARGVQVQGLVDNEDRKQEIEKSLHGIPFLSLKIQSFDDLKSLPGPKAPVAVTQQHTAVAEVSPLEHFFVEQGRSREDLSRISAGLFDSSLAVNRSSRAIEQLLLRFSATESLSPAAIRMRDELQRRNTARLLQDLKEQQNLLEETAIALEPEAIGARNSDAGARGFVGLAERNMVATRELISRAAESDHSEKQIATELAETISKLRSAVLTLHPETQQ